MQVLLLMVIMIYRQRNCYLRGKLGKEFLFLPRCIIACTGMTPGNHNYRHHVLYCITMFDKLKWREKPLEDTVVFDPGIKYTAMCETPPQGNATCQLSKVKVAESNYALPPKPNQTKTKQKTKTKEQRERNLERPGRFETNKICSVVVVVLLFCFVLFLFFVFFCNQVTRHLSLYLLLMNEDCFTHRAVEATGATTATEQKQQQQQKQQ